VRGVPPPDKPLEPAFLLSTYDTPTFLEELDRRDEELRQLQEAFAAERSVLQNRVHDLEERVHQLEDLRVGLQDDVYGMEVTAKFLSSRVEECNSRIHELEDLDSSLGPLLPDPFPISHWK
jgi:chromosome segregation ATPase